MILIITHRSDYTADFLIDKLNQSNINYFRLNCEDIPLINQVSISSDSQFKAKINSLTDFKSIWFRRTKFPNFNLKNEIESYYISELQAFQKNLWHSFKGKWLSKPDKVYEAENKIYQLKTAQELDFIIPDTLISYNPDEIKDFLFKIGRQMIVKPIFNNKFISNNKNTLIYTNRVYEKDLIGLKDSIPLPSIYQKYIPKDIEIRVTVVGNEVFAAYVNSQSNESTITDWRKEKLPFYAYNLPEDIKSKCIKLVNHLGISFGAIDIIKSKSGEYIFLEINPNGQWAWLEIDAGLPISNSIIKFLND